MTDWITTGIIAYTITSLFFTGFILALIKGGKRCQEEDEIEGNFEDLLINITPADTPFLRVLRERAEENK